MANSSQPSDDLPPAATTLSDWLLRRELEKACRQHLQAACLRQVHGQEDDTTFLEENHSLEALLMQCHWSINTYDDHNTLVIQCPNLMTNWRILEKIVHFGNLLEQWGIGKIRICPPQPDGLPLEIRVNELSVYRE